MEQIYRAEDVEKVVVELECVEDLLVEADALVGEGDLEKAMQCLLDAQKSIQSLHQLQLKRENQKRLRDIAMSMRKEGISADTVRLYV
ncbi:hypothetical protein [Rummeliibacillus sp. TYF-LIM-RU47]|uniref:hypothetical protein n=1 Tax=Rummeliibacillus sp. TYF-LIM-RU47 TaxID=2608406 RepID=UPI00123BA290|nr:hypothetical protein [Rummeliibacillus sp. TYF-LIM-RU47]